MTNGNGGVMSKTLLVLISVLATAVMSGLRYDIVFAQRIAVLETSRAMDKEQLDRIEKKVDLLLRGK